MIGDVAETALKSFAAGKIEGLRDAADWIDDAGDRMTTGSKELGWARGAAQYLRQLADDREAILAKDEAKINGR